MRIEKFKLLLFLFYWIVSFAAFAGETGKIAGRITDKATGEGLPGVNIVLVSTYRGAATDSEGYFTIINIPPGKYDLQVSMIGYSKVIVKSISVHIDKTTKQNVGLAFEVIQGETVTVIAERPLVEKDFTSTVYYVDSETIDALPVTNMNEIIEIQAGVVTGADGEMHFRGGREREVSYLLDGIPVSNTFSQSGGNNVVIENSIIQELQIISGTFNAEFGSALSGIVNVVTKNPSRESHGNLKIYAGDFVSNKQDILIGIDRINPISEYDVQGSLSVPLIPNKMGFFGTLRYNSSESPHSYERRFNPLDGWVINTYRRWFTERFSEELATSGRIHIPDSLRTGDGEIGPLGKGKDISYSGKFNYFPTTSTSITYSIFGHWSKSRAGGTFRRYQPDALATNFGNSNNHFLSFRHVLKDNFFYNIRLSYQNNSSKSFYQENNKIAEYPGDSGIQPISADSYGFSLGTTGGGFYGNDGKNFRKVYMVNGDLNWQLNRHNFIKAGFEIKQNDVNTYFFPLVPTEQWNRDKYTPAINGSDYEWPEYWREMVDYWKNWNETNDTTKFRFPRLDEITRYRDYTIKPLEAAAYIQDKVELGEFILNAGLRLDMYDPNEKTIINKRVESYLLGESDNLRKASIRYQLSPRFGFSFPISDRGAFHVAYGHFFQMPSFEKMYNEPLHVLTPIQLNGMQLGDSSLKPEKTISYEIGLQQEITSEYAVDVTAYYRDIRNQLGIEAITTVDAIGYTRYVNRDYGNVKGFTVALEKPSTGLVWGTIDYTFQFAKGSASNPDFIQLVQASTRLGGDPVQFIERQILALDWDQRHTVNMTLNIGKPSNWMVSFLGNLGGGLPYSPSSVEQFELPDREFKNSARKPVRWKLDLKARKFLSLSNMKYILFLNINNVFDHLNEMTVYSSTGRATHNAILPEEKATRDEFIIQEGIFLPSEIDVRPYWFSQPRRIRLGVELRF